MDIYSILTPFKGGQRSRRNFLAFFSTKVGVEKIISSLVKVVKFFCSLGWVMMILCNIKKSVYKGKNKSEKNLEK